MKSSHLNPSYIFRQTPHSLFNNKLIIMKFTKAILLSLIATTSSVSAFVPSRKFHMLL